VAAKNLALRAALGLSVVVVASFRAPARSLRGMGPKRSRYFAGGGDAAAKPPKARKAAPAAKKAAAKAKKTTTTPAAEKAAASPAKRAKFVPLSPPDGWRRQWAMCVELRKDRTAVVDSMGCGELTDPASPAVDRHYQILVSLMLSSQTRDTANAATMRVLLDRGLSVSRILDDTPPAEFEAILKAGAIGMYRGKTTYVYETSRKIRDDHGGAVPETYDGLVALKGVGPKMAILQLQHAFGRIEGISVDTHVHRISNQLGWTGGDTGKNPEKTRRAIESWIPKAEWKHINYIFVGLGQEVQTEKAKLTRKALASSDPPYALALLGTLGVDAAAVAKKEGLDLPA